MQCKKCNKEIPDQVTHCAYCGAATSEAIPNIQITPATTSKRFINYIVDGIGIMIVSSLVSASISGSSSWLLQWLVVPFVYYFISEVLWSKSPAKFVTNTKVVTEYGGKPTASQIAIRSIVRFIPFYPIFFLLTTKKGHRIGWHDRFAHTVVVED